MPAVGILCSGGGSNLQALIDRAATGELGGEVRWVLSNNGNAHALERARQAGIEAVHASAKSLGSDEAVEAKILELIDRLNELLGTDVEPSHEPPRAGDVRDSMADITVARALLGYEPQVDLEEGLRRSIEYYKSIA